MRANNVLDAHTAEFEFIITITMKYERISY